MTKGMQGSMLVSERRKKETEEISDADNDISICK